MARTEWSILEGYVLHQRPYRESSIIAEFFSREEGRFPIVLGGVRGARGRNARHGLIQPFDFLAMKTSPKGDMRRAELADHLNGSLKVTGHRTFFGFYVNELVYRLSTRFDAVPALFDLYHQFMEALKLDAFDARFVTGFEIEFLRALGYGVNFDVVNGGRESVRPGGRYHFDPVRGFFSDASGAITGEALTRVLREPDHALSLQLVRAIAAQVIDHLLSGRPINARQLCEQYR